MDEFLKQNYFLLTYFVECLAAVTAIFYYRKYRGSVAKYFCYFLIYSFCIDLVGRYPYYFNHLNIDYLIRETLIEKNYLFVTLFWFIGSTLFYLYFYYKILQNLLFKTILKYLTVLVIGIFVFELIFNREYLYNGYIPSIPTINCLSIFLAIMLYFIEILQTNQILHFYKSIYFYISCVLIIWWLITTPMIFYEIYFTTADWNFVFLKWQVYLFANLFMYLSFTFALIFCKPEHD